MKKLIRKLMNRETLLYLVFGVLTTVLNIAVFWLTNKAFGEELVLLNNAIAFAAAVIFAYVTNKLFVFESKSWSAKTLCREIPAFIGARLFSFGLEELLLWISKDVLNASQYVLFGIDGLMIAKLLIQVIVVILNYLFSKFFIFKKKQ